MTTRTRGHLMYHVISDQARETFPDARRSWRAQSRHRTARAAYAEISRRERHEFGPDNRGQSWLPVIVIDAKTGQIAPIDHEEEETR